MSSAVISECGKYRHNLTRKVSDKEGLLTFIMLNPSTADAELDDPTIRKCKGFCDRFGYGALQVVNLFDFRATNPDELKKTSYPASKHNMDIIRAAAIMSDKVICAWGTKGIYNRQNEKVLQMLGKENISLYALDITKDGHPKHPLYVPYDTELKRYCK